MLSDNEILKNAARNALKMMNNSGFKISTKIEVALDPKLPFMGYVTQRSDSYVIVVSGMALKSGLVEGLLVHEMCHVYRTITNHVSHNHELLNHVGHAVINEYQLSEDYQTRIIHQAINYIQDLYADDIAFQVFEKSKSFTHEQAFNFFLNWINDTPINSQTIKAKWLNTGTLLNNCFAISNLTRHNLKDIDNQAENKNQRFLSKVDKKLQREFTYFRNFMTNLKQNPTPQQFEKDITQYLTKIVELTR